MYSLTNIIIEVHANVVSQKHPKVIGIQTEEQYIKLSLFIGSIIFYTEIPKGITAQQLLELVNLVKIPAIRSTHKSK